MGTELATRQANQMARGQTALAVFPADKEGGAPVTALVKQTANGLVRSTLVRLKLDQDKGELWSMNSWDSAKRAYTEKRSITAAGYNKANLFLGVSFFTPERIIDDAGRPTANPYFHRDENDEIVYVKVRMIGLGRNATGNLVAQDLTVTYNLRTYFAQDLFSKWTGKKSEMSKDWGKLLPLKVAQKVAKDNELVVPVAGGSALVIDLGNKDVAYCLGEHLNRQKYAERNAVTICQRNILKKFSGAAVTPDGYMNLVSWTQPDRDFVEIGKKVAEANDGRIIIDDQPVDTVRETQTLDSKEAVDEALQGSGDYDDNDQPPDDGPGENETPGSVAASAPAAPPSKPQPSQKAVDLLAQIRDACENLDGDAIEDVAGSLGYRGWTELTAETDELKLAQALVAYRKKAIPPSDAPASSPSGGQQSQLPLGDHGRSRTSHRR